MSSSPDAPQDAVGPTAATTPPSPPNPPAPPTMTLAQCAQELATRFPALFGPQVGPLPIKLRIHVDIAAQAPGVFTRRVLAAFLSRHTTSTAYLKALVRSPHRFDLHGQPAGEIEAAHRQAAQEELARRLPRPRPKPKAQPRQRVAHEGRDPRPRRPPVPSPDDELSRLLKAFHSTALSKTNFCALQGIAVETLDAALRKQQDRQR